MKTKRLFPYILFFLTLLFLYSCGSGKYLYQDIQQNEVYKGVLKDGRSVYFVNNLKSEQLMLGNYFYEDHGGITDVYQFSTDKQGNALLHTDAIPFHSKFKGDKSKLTIEIPNKEKVNLQLWESVPQKSSYRERYAEKIFKEIDSLKNIEYIKSSGFYTSYPIAHIPNRTLKNLSSDLFQTIGKSMNRKTNVSLQLDIYEPKRDFDLKRPVILYIHGGAFYFGDKENTLQNMFKEEYVEKGYVVVSMNYRLGTNIKEGTKAIEKAIYTGVQDVRSAIRYLIKNQERFRIDPKQIYLAGNSAGGIIATTMAYMDSDEIFLSIHDDWKEFGPLDPVNDRMDNSFRPAGLISMWGAMVEPQIIGNNPPLPTLLFHGTADDLVNPGKGLPYKNFFQTYLDHRVGSAVTSFVNTFLLSNWTMYGSEEIHKYMQSQKLPSRYITFPGYGHEPQENEDGSFNKNYDILKNEIGNFLKENVLNYYFDSEIQGPVRLTSNTKTLPAYSLSKPFGYKIDWFVEGGFITLRENNRIEVIWFKNSPVKKKVIAYLTNVKGETAKKELEIE